MPRAAWGGAERGNHQAEGCGPEGEGRGDRDEARQASGDPDSEEDVSEGEHHGEGEQAEDGRG